jgi:hypothetical protein
MLASIPSELKKKTPPLPRLAELFVKLDPATVKLSTLCVKALAYRILCVGILYGDPLRNAPDADILARLSTNLELLILMLLLLAVFVDVSLI